MTSDLIQRLLKQLLICFALVACLTLMMLFSSKVHVGWLVYPALLIGEDILHHPGCRDR